MSAFAHDPSQQNDSSSSSNNREQFANALGWFSIAVGLAEILIPHELAKLIGVESKPPLFRALGLREITSGIGILTQRKPAGWLWSRVAGDVMDLALLGIALASDDSEKEKVTAATAAVLGVTAADVLCAWQLTSAPGETVHVSKTIAVERPPEEVYQFWRNFENLPRFMQHLESVRVLDERRSHWVARAPAGMRVHWDAELTEDRPNELIAWRSLPSADVENAGSVRFEPAPGGRGTFVRVTLGYRPPGGFAGASIAKLFGEEPEQQVQTDLYRFKQVMETGQVTTTDGQPAGRPSSTSPLYDTNNTEK